MLIGPIYEILMRDVGFTVKQLATITGSEETALHDIIAHKKGSNTHLEDALARLILDTRRFSVDTDTSLRDFLFTQVPTPPPITIMWWEIYQEIGVEPLITYKMGALNLIDVLNQYDPAWRDRMRRPLEFTELEEAERVASTNALATMQGKHAHVAI